MPQIKYDEAYTFVLLEWRKTKEWLDSASILANAVMYRDRDHSSFTDRLRLVLEFETQTDLANFKLGFKLDK